MNIKPGQALFFYVSRKPSPSGARFLSRICINIELKTFLTIHKLCWNMGIVNVQSGTQEPSQIDLKSKSNQPQIHRGSTPDRTKIDPKSSKITPLGGPGTPRARPGPVLGTPWGPDAQKHQKSDLVDPPTGAPKAVFPR